MKLQDIVNMKTAVFGAVVGTVTYMLSWIATIFGIGARTIKLGNFATVTGAIADVNVRSQITSSGVANRLGLYVMQLLRYVPNWDWGQYIIIVLGSIVLVMVGKAVYLGAKWTPRGSAKTKLYLQLLYGAIVITATVSLIGGMLLSMAFINLTIAMAIYYGLVALALWAIVKTNFLWLGKFITKE